MQIDWTDCFKQRLLFGASHAIVKQLNKGDLYQLLQPVYGLGIIADVWNKQGSDWYHHYRLVKTGEKAEDVIEHLQLVFIELPKFKPNSREGKRLRLLWLRFFREIDENTTEVSQELLDVPEIREAVELAEQAAYTPAELSAYETYWDSIRTERSLMQGRYDEGKAEGEAKKAREIAKACLQQGLSVSATSTITGLSMEEISRL
jgi:predicted transposase/invertase (TIGR01784 family)